MVGQFFCSYFLEFLSSLITTGCPFTACNYFILDFSFLVAEIRKQREFYHKLGMEVPGDIKAEMCVAKQHVEAVRNGRILLISCVLHHN